ncbi:MAG: tRNA (adenosine(37)-N6)-threonylcarbamoyltransferase complex transferase subunit TsaD [Bacteriovoracia bacterium]
MKILSIETSCDETAISLLEANGEKNEPEFKILGNVLYSQIEKHREFGGVFPSLAKREHALNLVPLLEKILKETGLEKIPENEIVGIEPNTQKEVRAILAREPELFDFFIKYISKIKKPEIDLITVTAGPGLEPALWVGINFARALSLVWQIPVIPVNHMEGHITSVLIDPGAGQKISFPALSLLISGGHTQLVLIKGWGQYEIIGNTKDDAIGEAYDKVARLLDLPYPGGPQISALADIARNKIESGENFLNPENPKEKISFEEVCQKYGISLPRPMLSSGDYNFSFSGIKTAVLYLIKRLKEEYGENSSQNNGPQNEIPDKHLDEEIKSLVALEFETAVTEVLFKKTLRALDEFNAKDLIIGGGVIANKNIRETFARLQNDSETRVWIPEIDLTTDNAIMIGIAGYLNYVQNPDRAKINLEIVADGNLAL